MKLHYKLIKVAFSNSQPLSVLCVHNDTGFGAQQRHLALSWRHTIYENGGRRS